jgi:hypothetical protein
MGLLSSVKNTIASASKDAGKAATTGALNTALDPTTLNTAMDRVSGHVAPLVGRNRRANTADSCHVTPTTSFLLGALLGVKQKVSKDFSPYQVQPGTLKI